MRDRYAPSNSKQNAMWTKVILGLAVFIFIVLIAKFMSGNDANLDTAKVSLRLADASSNAQIISGENDEKDVTSNTPLADQDLVEIKNGNGQIAFLSNTKNMLNLNNGTKIRYIGQDGSAKSQFRLENKDVWIQADTADMTFDLIGVTITPTSNTIANVSKNELFTVITVLQGSVTVNLSGATTEISAGQQVNYSTLRALTLEDITTRVAPINPDNLSTDWMKINNASAYLSTISNTGTGTNPATVGSGLLVFEYPIDESKITDKTTITVTGKLLATTISRVSINGVSATLDPASQSFSLANVSLGAKENNLIYRAYDTTGTLVSKGVITVYNEKATGTTTATTADPTVETLKLDNRFRIVSPSTDFYETRESKVKIEGAVTPNVAHHMTINDTLLKSFSGPVGTWYYFANQQFGNLGDGMNIYTIRYFDKNDVEIYKQIFIIKKLPPFSSTKPATTTAQ